MGRGRTSSSEGRKQVRGTDESLGALETQNDGANGAHGWVEPPTSLF